jgi:hypothetical protein
MMKADILRLRFAVVETVELWRLHQHEVPVFSLEMELPARTDHILARNAVDCSEKARMKSSPARNLRAFRSIGLRSKLKPRFDG